MNTHALVGKFGTTKTAELKEGLKGKIFDLTANINKKVGNKEAAPAVEEVAQLVVEFAMFVVICFVVRMLLVTAFHHTIEKHFNFLGAMPPDPRLRHEVLRECLRHRGVNSCEKS